MRILLTNTRVPRSTKLLVASVKVLYEELPQVIKPILESIEGISQRFLEIIARCRSRRNRSQDLLELSELLMDNEEEAAQIGQLFRINHSLLNALGVGHSSLNAVSTVSAQKGLPCKLTGAGGGGCAMTLLPSQQPSQQGHNDSSIVDNGKPSNIVDELKLELHELAFDTFESSLAGCGVQWHI